MAVKENSKKVKRGTKHEKKRKEKIEKNVGSIYKRKKFKNPVFLGSIGSEHNINKIGEYSASHYLTSFTLKILRSKNNFEFCWQSIR